MSAESRVAEAQRLAHVGSWEWDTATDAVTWSEELYRIYGLTNEQFEGTYEGFLARVHPDDRAATRAVILSAFRDPRSFSYDHRIVRGTDGAVRMLQTRGDVVRAADGAVARMVGCCVDITERWEATRKLESSLSLLRATLESTADGILVLDLSDRVVACNARALKLWGIPEALAASGGLQAMLSHVKDLFEDWSGFERRERELIADKEYSGLVEIRLKDGRVFERYTQPQRVGGCIIGRVCSFRDVTAQRCAEERLRKVLAGMEERVRERTAQLADSNAELEVFAFAAAHDMSTPLRKILAFSELLEKQLGPRLEPEDLKLLFPIRKSAVGLAKLLSDVLELSRVSRDHFPVQEVDLNSTLAEVVFECEAVIAESGAVVEYGGLPKVRANPGMMRRLFQNLVENAIKFRDKDRPPRVQVYARSLPNCGAEVFVKDNGIGFDPRFAFDVFQPFHRLNPTGAYEGSGIGLAICKRIAQRYGAEITADSVPGHGSIFTLHFSGPNVVSESRPPGGK